MTQQTGATAKVEEYLEAVYNIAMEGEAVIGARLAEKFQVAPPSVTEMLKRLVRDGYIEMDERRQVTLTSEGQQLAEAVLRRHRLTERFLVDMLGMSWHEVHEEACRLEHFISGAVEQRVVAALGHPTTCPHGNPIPGYVPDAKNYLAEHQAFRLSQADQGVPVRILCISEVVEDEEELILYLNEKGLKPEQVLRLSSQNRDEAAALLDVSGRAVSIPERVASKIWVVKA
ncbi:MAG TPA: metal-dependent transcriptional regulator [Ktedonobacterales bacterium]|jgi:DtxR family Mn-dependent transcriptional regulator